MATTISEAIEQAAAEPQSVTVDGTTVVNADIHKLIEADNHVAKKAAASSNRAPFQCFRIRPPGAV